MTTFPSALEYDAAILAPEQFMLDPVLARARTVMREGRADEPFQIAGGYARVYKLEAPDGRVHAFRCWSIDIGDAAAIYHHLDAYLRRLRTPCFVRFRFLPEALMVSGEKYPAVRMDWIQAPSLQEFVKQNLGRPQVLEVTAEVFLATTTYLHEVRVAHGDLQADNIKVRVGPRRQDIVLVDYDTMYVPALQGTPSVNAGLASYQHPKRLGSGCITEKDDYFSEYVIYLALISLARSPRAREYFESLRVDKDLLFSETDFSRPGRSEILGELRRSGDALIERVVEGLDTALALPGIDRIEPLEAYLARRRAQGASAVAPLGDAGPRDVPTAPSPGERGHEDSVVRPPEAPPSPHASHDAAATTASDDEVAEGMPWSKDCEGLVRGMGADGDRVVAWIDRAGAEAAASDLTAAAESLESARRILVYQEHFHHYDNDIWAFVDIVRLIRHQSPEPHVPAAYQRFLDATPHLTMERGLTTAQAAFWYECPPPSMEGSTCFTGHTERVLGVALSPDGTQALSSGWDSIVRLWDPSTGEEIRQLKGHQGFVPAVAFAGDGRRALSGGADRTVRVWDVASGEEIHCMTGHSFTVFALAVSPDGRSVISGGGDSIRLWDVESGRHLRRFGGFFSGNASAGALAFSPDGRWALSGSLTESGLRLWDVASGKEVRRFEGPVGTVKSVAFLPDGRRAISSDASYAVRIWDLASGRAQESIDSDMKIPGQMDPDRLYPTIGLFALSPDGRRLLSETAYDTALHLFDLERRRHVARLEGHRRSVNCLAVSRDGRTALSGSDDHTARSWRLDGIR